MKGNGGFSTLLSGCQPLGPNCPQPCAPSPIKAIVGINFPVTNGGQTYPLASGVAVVSPVFSAPLNQTLFDPYDAASVVNNWNMTNIPFGQCLFVFFSYGGGYEITTTMPAAFLAANPGLSATNPSAANLNQVLAAQDLYQEVNGVMVPIGGGGACLGGESVCGCVTWFLFRSQYRQLPAAWKVRAFGPTVTQNGAIIPIYSGTPAATLGCFGPATVGSGTCMGQHVGLGDAPCFFIGSAAYEGGAGVSLAGGLLNLPVPCSSLSAPNPDTGSPATIPFAVNHFASLFNPEDPGPFSIAYALTLNASC